MSYKENKSFFFFFFFFSFLKIAKILLQKLVIFKMIPDSSLVEKQGTLEGDTSANTY